MRSMLEELESTLARINMTTKDIKVVATANYRLDVGEFLEKCKETYYDPYSGQPIVAGDLVVFGAGWSLTRNHHSTLEWWEINAKPTVPYEKYEGDFELVGQPLEEFDDINKKGQAYAKY